MLVSSFIGFGVFSEPVHTDSELGSQILGGSEAVSKSQDPGVELKAKAQKDDSQKEVAKVVRVIDGDTIELEGGEKVRYIGVDSPESLDQRKPKECFAQEATQRNRDLVLDKEVVLEKDVSELDRYGRLYGGPAYQPTPTPHPTRVPTAIPTPSSSPTLVPSLTVTQERGGQGISDGSEGEANRIRREEISTFQRLLNWIKNLFR